MPQLALAAPRLHPSCAWPLEPRWAPATQGVPLPRAVNRSSTTGRGVVTGESGKGSHSKGKPQSSSSTGNAAIPSAVAAVSVAPLQELKSATGTRPSTGTGTGTGEGETEGRERWSRGSASGAGEPRGTEVPQSASGEAAAAEAQINSRERDAAAGAGGELAGNVGQIVGQGGGGTGEGRSKATAKASADRRSSLSLGKALPLPMTTPHAEPLSLEQVEELLQCDPEIQTCKEPVYQWVSECSNCQGTGFAQPQSSSGRGNSRKGRKGSWASGSRQGFKCIICCGVGAVYRFTVRNDIPVMEDINKQHS